MCFMIEIGLIFNFSDWFSKNKLVPLAYYNLVEYLLLSLAVTRCFVDSHFENETLIVDQYKKL